MSTAKQHEKEVEPSALGYVQRPIFAPFVPSFYSDILYKQASMPLFIIYAHRPTLYTNSSHLVHTGSSILAVVPDMILLLVLLLLLLLLL